MSNPDAIVGAGMALTAFTLALLFVLGVIT